MKTLPLNPRRGWFSLTGPEQDVILTSRVRVSRNWAGFPFVHRLERPQETQILKALRSAVESESTGLTGGSLGNLTLLQRRLLVERGLVDPQVSLHLHKDYYSTPDDRVTIQVLGRDHARIAGFSGGLSLPEAWHYVRDADRKLGSRLGWALHPAFGYLGPRIRNTGSGLKASLLLHIPAIERFELLGRVLHTVETRGFSLTGFWGSDHDSNGSLYVLSNRFSAGWPEEEILEEADKLARQILQFERSARDSWQDHHPDELLDRVWRAFGLLNYAHEIRATEAWDLLSRLRLGICLDIIKGVHLRKTLPAFTLTLKAHVAAFDQTEDSGGPVEREDARASLLKVILFSARDEDV